MHGLQMWGTTSNDRLIGDNIDYGVGWGPDFLQPILGPTPQQGSPPIVSAVDPCACDAGRGQGQLSHEGRESVHHTAANGDAARARERSVCPSPPRR